MRCAICDKEFEPKRADAKFCGGACRKKASRGVEPEKKSEIVAPRQEEMTMVEMAVGATDQAIGESPDIMTPDGQVRQVWDKEHPVPNLENGYFHIGQTQQEYIDNLPERGYLKNGEKCEHPATESFHSRCLLCNEMLRYVRVGEAFMKASDKKKKDAKD